MQFGHPVGQSPPRQFAVSVGPVGASAGGSGVDGQDSSAQAAAQLTDALAGRASQHPGGDPDSFSVVEQPGGVGDGGGMPEGDVAGGEGGVDSGEPAGQFAGGVEASSGDLVGQPECRADLGVRGAKREVD